MTQPPYSPYLVPYDFWLFPKLKSPLKGKRFETVDEIQENRIGQLMAENCVKNWENCVKSQGAYFEGDWGVIVLCAMFLASCIFNKCLFFVLHGWIPSGQTYISSNSVVYSQHAVYHIPSTSLSCNWKCVPFDHLSPVPSSLPPKPPNQIYGLQIFFFHSVGCLFTSSFLLLSRNFYVWWSPTCLFFILLLVF